VIDKDPLIHLSSSESTIAFTIVIVEVGDVEVPWQQLEARLITVEGHGTGLPAVSHHARHCATVAPRERKR
jgi:hypothetical protein